MENDQYLLRMVNVEKTFPGVRALKGVNLNVKRGEVHALVGETGAPVCELDPMTTGPADPPLDYYEVIMLQNMKSLQTALQ